MERNFLNLSDFQKEKYIYRFIPFYRLVEIFKNKTNVLVNPKKWDDPFENFIMNSTGELQNGEMFSIGFRENFYGQCWTLTRESDAMWRIYSPQKDGVRIRTTPRKLLKSLYNVSGNTRDISCYVGKVKYYTTKKLKELLEKFGSKWILDNTGAGQAQTFLFKRTPFKHENEVRIIYNSFGNLNSDIFSYKIDPYELIDYIVFDPRIDYSIFKNKKSELKNLGFKKRIVKSNLYKAPNLSFKV